MKTADKQRKYSLPYFDLILEKFGEYNKNERNSFNGHVHWGYWSKNKKIDIPNYNIAQTQLSKRFLDLANLKNNSKILDVGCGLGGTTKILNSNLKNCKIYAINIDQRQLDFAQEKINPSNSNTITFQNMDACKMSFKENYFDSILALETIFHFSSRERFFQDSSKILKSGGSLVITDFVPIFPFGRILNLVEFFFKFSKPTYGDVNLNISMHKYSRLAKRNGLNLETSIDITKKTLPTYSVLKQHFCQLDKENERLFNRTNRIMYFLSKIGILRYKIILFRKK